jgi:hypothetical protein
VGEMPSHEPAELAAKLLISVTGLGKSTLPLLLRDQFVSARLARNLLARVSRHELFSGLDQETLLSCSVLCSSARTWEYQWAGVYLLPGNSYLLEVAARMLVLDARGSNSDPW